MGHKELLKSFIEHHPQWAGDVELWFPYGKNSIRVRLSNRREYICTYDSKTKDWSVETIKSVLKRQKQKG